MNISDRLLELLHEVSVYGCDLEKIRRDLEEVEAEMNRRKRNSSATVDALIHIHKKLEHKLDFRRRREERENGG